jgi:hypothetical protein
MKIIGRTNIEYCKNISIIEGHVHPGGGLIPGLQNTVNHSDVPPII